MSKDPFHGRDPFQEFVRPQVLEAPSQSHVRAYRGLGVLWYSADDLLKSVGYSSTASKRLKKLNKYEGETALKRVNVISEHKKWKPYRGGEEVRCIRTLVPFIKWCLRARRCSVAEKSDILFKLTGLEENGEDLNVVAEEEIMKHLIKSCPYKVERQYLLAGHRRLDGYIPSLRIAIQIDEHGHQGYDHEDEAEYEQLIRSSNMILLRVDVDPNSKDSIYEASIELIGKVFKRVASPDYQAFKMQQLMPFSSSHEDAS